MAESPDDLIGAGEAARLIGVSATYLRKISNDGRVAFETTEPYGHRAYRRSEVERFQREREAARTAAA